MRRNSKRVTGNEETLIVDTSVIINLHKSDHGHQIIKSLSERIVVTQIVKAELDRIESRTYETHDFLKQILGYENVSLVELTDEEKKFRKILADDVNLPDIEDGEASVIAVCRHSFTGDNCIPVIDDRKGRAVAIKILKNKGCGHSLNLFLHPSVLSKLGTEKASDALYSALLNARMAIPKSYTEQVVEFIGDDRARECKSLPGYKQLFL